MCGPKAIAYGEAESWGAYVPNLERSKMLLACFSIFWRYAERLVFSARFVLVLVVKCRLQATMLDYERFSRLSEEKLMYTNIYNSHVYIYICIYVFIIYIYRCVGLYDTLYLRSSKGAGTHGYV